MLSLAPRWRRTLRFSPEELRLSMCCLGGHRLLRRADKFSMSAVPGAMSTRPGGAPPHFALELDVDVVRQVPVRLPIRLARAVPQLGYAVSRLCTRYRPHCRQGTRLVRGGLCRHSQRGHALCVASSGACNASSSTAPTEIRSRHCTATPCRVAGSALTRQVAKLLVRWSDVQHVVGPGSGRRACPPAPLSVGCKRLHGREIQLSRVARRGVPAVLQCAGCA